MFTAAALVTPPASACATAGPPASPPIRIEREEALIVWDAAKKEEHFVRRAVFDTQVKSFAFLVPTPSRPTLAEVPASVFSVLGAATKPREVTEKKTRLVPFSVLLSPLLMRTRSAAPVELAAAAPAARVTVLEQTQVAGMDATVLTATDTDALARWLTEHGYPLRPELRDWLVPYVTAGFTITAFQYARPEVASLGGVAPSVAPSAVRLSFATDRPFYPYREPRDAPEVDARELHLFLVGPSRSQGELGARGTWPTATTQFADALAPALLADQLPGVALPRDLWLTEVVDLARRREAEDVYVRPDPNQAKLERPPIVHVEMNEVVVPLDVLWIVGGVGLFVRWRRRRARAPEK